MERKDSKPSLRAVNYPFLLATRVDAYLLDSVQDMAYFDRKKPAVWLRDLIVEAVKRYERNPQYKRWRSLEETRERKKEAVK